VTRRRLRTRPHAVTDTGHLTELLYDDGESDGTVVCAFHGGDVEPGTAELALEVATRVPSVVCWAVLGYDDGGAYDAWHPPSKAVGPGEYRLMDRVVDRGFRQVLSLHGLAEEAVVVGGRAPADRRASVCERLDAALPLPVRTATDGPYAGRHRSNPVNRLAVGPGGVQVELGPAARGDHAERTVAALVGSVDGHDSG